MNPKFYLVGGAVRDQLLERESQDRDYVVVGATPQWMIEHGFTQVGQSFPVYLHPKTGDEYALARQERKVGHGYKGFEVTYDPDVTLEDDLKRRDLTINAIAMDDEGNVFDPHDGIKDLHDGVLRHVSDAFAEDPLRVLRVARFAARYNFRVADETITLCRKIVESDELEYLPRERIWTELWKGMSESDPTIMIGYLATFGALDREPLKRFFPDHAIMNPWARDVMVKATIAAIPNPFHITTEQKFLMLMTGVTEMDQKTALHYRVPTDLWKMSKLYTQMEDYLCDTPNTPEGTLEFLSKTKYGSNYGSVESKTVVNTLFMQDLHGPNKTDFAKNFIRLHLAIQKIGEIDMAAVTADRTNIKEKVQAAKLAAIRSAFEENS